MANIATGAIDPEKTRGVPYRQRLLGNKLGRQIVGEVIKIERREVPVVDLIEGATIIVWWS